jgi:hypothetical protein
MIKPSENGYWRRRSPKHDNAEIHGPDCPPVLSKQVGDSVQNRCSALLLVLPSGFRHAGSLQVQLGKWHESSNTRELGAVLYADWCSRRPTSAVVAGQALPAG